MSTSRIRVNQIAEEVTELEDEDYLMADGSSLSAVNKTKKIKKSDVFKTLGYEKVRKYARIKAVSPGTFTVNDAFGWTVNPTVALVGGNIVITSSGSEFSNDSLIAVSQLDTTFSQTTSTITLTPASASWGTMTIIVKIY